MALLMFRTFGVIIVSFIVLIMYVLHRKKNGKFIKRKAVNEEEKIKYQKWEKIINVMAVVGLLILGIFITVPCCLDIPYLLSNNLVEVTGEVTQGAMSGENSNSERRIHIRVLQIKVNRFCRKSPKKYSADSRVKMRTANRTPSKIGGSQMA